MINMDEKTIIKFLEDHSVMYGFEQEERLVAAMDAYAKYVTNEVLSQLVLAIKDIQSL